jgi:hypothetical protein
MAPFTFENVKLLFINQLEKGACKVETAIPKFERKPANVHLTFGDIWSNFSGFF